MAVSTNEEFGNVLLKVQDDISRLKQQLGTTDSDGKVNIEELSRTLKTAEQRIQAKAAELLHNVDNEVYTLPSLEAQLASRLGPTGGATTVLNESRWDIRPNTRGAAQLRRTGPNGFLESRGMEVPPPESMEDAIYPSDMRGMNVSIAPGEQFKYQRDERMLQNPQNIHARCIAHDKLGIQLPMIPDRRSAKMPFDRVVKGSNVDKLAALPRSNRVDPGLAPPPITNNDAKKGILSLLERGLIPPAAELSLYPPPVRHKTVPLNDPRDKLRDRIPADTSEPGSMFPGVYLDTSIRPMDILATMDSSVGAGKAAKASPQLQAATTTAAATPAQDRMPQERVAAATIKEFELPLQTQDTEYGSYIDNRDRRLQQLVPPPTTPAIQLYKSNRSSNRFAIHDAVTHKDQADFEAFKQNFCLQWGPIVTTLKKLEKFLLTYSIPIAFVSGEKLAELAIENELEQRIVDEEFLECLINKDDVLKLIKEPGRLYIGPEGPERAAIRIQAAWRGHVDRRNYLDYRQKKWAAGVIAIQWILHMKMIGVKKQLKATRMRQLENYRQRAKLFTDHWDQLKNTKRVIIHIPSLGYAEKLRESVEDFSRSQNSQMARLCDLKDPNVEVIYVSPVPLNDELIQYYSKLLALRDAVDSGQIEDQKPINDRFKLIVPEAIKNFSQFNMCLATLLKYSPRALRRIRALIRGREGRTYIVPGVPSADDIAVADHLGVAVLAPEPELAHLYSTKSGGKRIFASAGAPLPPGDYDIYSADQMHETLAQLITENLSIRRWLLKIDSEFGGRGIAYIDVAKHLGCYGWALKERERYGEKWAKKWAQENAFIRISSEIADVMENHAKPTNTRIYPTWQKFRDAFLAKGGIIEASPNSDSTTNLSVDVLIEPTANYRLLCSGDQIHQATRAYEAWGLSVPQSSVSAERINAYVEGVVRACVERHLYGHVAVDFVTFIEPDTDMQVVWATDLSLRYADSVAMMKLAEFATNFCFNAFEHTITVAPKPVPEDVLKRRRRGLLQDPEKEENLNRFITMSTNLIHTNMSVVHYSVFFQTCRAHGIGFDVTDHEGTIFTLSDSFDRENMGMVTVAGSLDDSLKMFGQNLYTIHKEITSPNMEGTTNFLEVIDNISEIIGQTIENAEDDDGDP